MSPYIKPVIEIEARTHHEKDYGEREKNIQ